MSTTDRYKYLGVTFQSNGRWHAHFDALASKCSLTANFIGRINHRYRPPSPIITIKLVNAILVRQLAYGIAFCRFNQQQLHKLDQILAAPLRRALALPKSASAIRTLWESGVPSVRAIRALDLIQTASRAVAAHANGVELAQLLAEQLQGDSTNSKSPVYCRPLVEEIRVIQRSYPVVARLPASQKATKSLLAQVATAEWQRRASSKAQIIKPHFGVASYLYIDPKPTSWLRSRLRLGVALTPMRKHLYKLQDSNLCQGCQVPGTSEHMVMWCEQFLIARAVCRAKLEQLYVPVELTMQLVLGEPPDPPDRFKKERRFLELWHEQCLGITGEFLIAINKEHPL